MNVHLLTGIVVAAYSVLIYKLMSRFWKKNYKDINKDK